jgi:antitoxin Phd
LATWQVQDAKARFSELLETTLQKGPQIVTRRGVEAAVLVPIEEWHQLQRCARPGLKALLLGGARALKTSSLTNAGFGGGSQ